MFQVRGAEVKNFACFKSNWSGIPDIKRLNVIIGPNNAGKSRLLEFLFDFAALLDQPLPFPWDFRLYGTVRYQDLATFARETELRNGLELEQIERLKLDGLNVIEYWSPMGSNPSYEFLDSDYLGGRKPYIVDICFNYLMAIPDWKTRLVHPMFSRERRILSAVRSIHPSTSTPSGDPEGGLVRPFFQLLTGSSAPAFKRSTKARFLDELNYIIDEHHPFTDISFRKSDSSFSLTLENESSDHWDIETMGVGVKEVVLILFECFIQKEGQLNRPKATLFIEEPENNLHPRAQRRLAQFLRRHSEESDEMIFITTHSNVLLNEFSGYADCSITRVDKLPDSSETTNLSSLIHLRQTQQKLGMSPGDLLMANGVIWVEGPSDRIILAQWIKLYCEEHSINELVEGRDFAFAFLGGVNATHHTADLGIHEGYGRLAVHRINLNFFFVLDQDKIEGEPLKDHVLRLQSECESSGMDPVPIWITDGREIENYFPLEAWKAAYPNHSDSASDPKEGTIWTRASGPGWLATFLNRTKDPTKTEVAERLSRVLTPEMMLDEEQWLHRMKILIKSIQSWNT